MSNLLATQYVEATDIARRELRDVQLRQAIEWMGAEAEQGDMPSHLHDKASIDLIEYSEYVNDAISAFVQSRLSPLHLAPHISDRLEYQLVARAKGDHVTLS